MTESDAYHFVSGIFIGIGLTFLTLLILATDEEEK